MSAVRARAEALGRMIPRASLQPAACARIDRSVRRGAIAAAISGGADSVALLVLLWFHWPAARKRLVALHFNHRLRGRAADADERYCRELCRRLGIRFLSGAWDRPKTVDRRKKPSEAEARQARFDFITAACARARCRVVCLGHNLDDIAESMLMRLARGSGSGGLSAPRPVQEFPRGRVHVRPLLTISRDRIRRALREAGIRWREDASNATDAHLRNRIRRSVLPALQAASPGRDVLAGAALARARLEEDDLALEQWVDELDPLRGRTLLLERLAGRAVAVVRRAVHRWIARIGMSGVFSRQAFDALVEAARSRSNYRQSLGSDGFAIVRDGRLTYGPRDRMAGARGGTQVGRTRPN